MSSIMILIVTFAKIKLSHVIASCDKQAFVTSSHRPCLTAPNILIMGEFHDAISIFFSLKKKKKWGFLQMER